MAKKEIQDQKEGDLAERVSTLERVATDVLLMLDELNTRCDELQDRLYLRKKVLTLSEASDYTGLKESYIYRLTSSKQIPHFKPKGKLVFFLKSELEAWLCTNNVPAIQQQLEDEPETEVGMLNISAL